jgi:hypothetical protein
MANRKKGASRSGARGGPAPDAATTAAAETKRRPPWIERAIHVARVFVGQR